MFINDFFKTKVTESKQAISDYDTWSDQVAAQGGEVHPQQDRNRLVAQSWDGDTMGEFNLRTNQGWVNGQQGVEENRKSDFRNTVEQQQRDAIERIKNSDYSDVVKLYLIAINDPAGPVFKALYRSITKGNEATEQLKNIFAQKYNVDPAELEKAELNYIAKQVAREGVAEDTTPDDEKAIELFAQIVADDTGYDVERINYYTYDEGLRTPSGIPVYYYSFDGDVRYVGALPGGKPTAIVNQDGEVGSRGSYIELSIGGQVEYVIKGKTLFSAADQQKIANAKPGDDEYSLVMIALDLMWGRMQHKFMEQDVAEGSLNELKASGFGGLPEGPKPDENGYYHYILFYLWPPSSTGSKKVRSKKLAPDRNTPEAEQFFKRALGGAEYAGHELYTGYKQRMQDIFRPRPGEQGVAEGLGKDIKRAAQGWGGAQDKPADIVKRNKGYDTDTAKKVRAHLDDAPDHTPAGLQKRVLDRKLKGVAEGKGDFAQAIDNLSGWHEEESDNPDIRIWVFDDREGGWYAQGTVYHNVKTGRVKIEFEDRADAWGGDVNDTFDSIGDAMKVLKNITGQISPNTGKAQDFDKLGGRTVAGPDDLYKTDRVGKKGTLNKTRMDIMKAFSPYRKTGPEGQLPESGVAETTGDPKFDKMLKGITGKRQVAKQQKADTKQQARDAFGGMFGGGNPADSLGIRKKNVDEGNELPANVIDMIKKIAQSSAAPEHKTAMINALIAKYKDHNMAEAEGDPEGLPHLTKKLLTNIVNQVGKEGAHAIIKSLEWGDGAADELLQLIVNDLKKNVRGEVDETYGAQLHTKHKKNRFKQIKKIKQTQNKAFGLSEAGCTMTKAGRECPVHGMNECPGYEMTETSPQDKLHQRHQEIRKKSGLPHPDHYLKMMKQKQAEIDALRAEVAADKAKGLGEATVTPRIGGFQQTIDDDGTVTSDYNVGPVSASTVKRPNTINTTSATVPLAHNVQATVDRGIGFGGAGKNIQQGGNQVTSITARTSQNPQGTTSSFVGQPTAQDLEKAVPPDWESSGNEFSDEINEAIERYVEALSRAGYDLQEEKVRLDPKCWKGKKIGNPKTKVKGGVRVNNCVPK